MYQSLDIAKEILHKAPCLKAKLAGSGGSTKAPRTICRKADSPIISHRVEAKLAGPGGSAKVPRTICT